jgi:hypothetical protein
MSGKKEPVLCAVCRNAAARYPTSEEPKCASCERVLRYLEEHKAPWLEVSEDRARKSLMRAVIRLRRIHAARYGVASLAPFTPRPDCRVDPAASGSSAKVTT